MRKKSPKPTRYMRTFRPLALALRAAFFDLFFVGFFAVLLVALRAVALRVDFFVRVVISQSRMQHVEVQLETTGIVPFEQSFTQIEVSLAALASFAIWTIKPFPDYVTQ